MRYAILGDIHANLSALEAVLAQIDRLEIDQILSVGDVVGYGAAPREVLEILRERAIPVVQGNHDAAVAGVLDASCFNALARQAAEWTREVLTPDEIDWLKALPLLHEAEHCVVGHGSYAEPEQFQYIQSTEDADPSLDLQTRPVCFVGHTHWPVCILRLREDPERTFYTMEASLDLSIADKALINVGSVGQPRDEDPRAAVGILDTEKRTYDLLRIEYDIEREASRIRGAGLPELLAGRLFMGI
ncbi:MAG: metallophosphoesterase family protein [Planctomycetota bacterium]